MTRGLKRSGRLLAGGLALALVAAGCGFGGDDEGGGGDSGDGTTINLLAPSYTEDDTTKQLWSTIIADFEKDNPDITVNLEMQSWTQINDVVRTKLQSEDTTPDILNIDAYASFAQDDLLYKAEDVLSAETVDDIEPVFAENASLDGTMYGMPLFASTRALFYNKDLFKQAGVKQPPKNWDELLDASKKIAEVDGVSGYGLPLGKEEAQAETSIWTIGAGGSWGDTDELTIETDENLAGIEQMKTMIDAGVTQPNPGSSNRTDDVLNPFMQGKIGMAEGLPPIVGQIEADYPDLNYGISPMPTESGEPATLGVADHLMAFEKDGSKQDAIRAFLDYFYSPKVYANFVKTLGFIPITKSAGEELSDDPAIKPFLSTLDAAQFYPSNNPAWPAVQGALQSDIGTIGQGTDPADVLGKIAEAAESGS